MKIEFININDILIADIISDHVLINETQDALDILVNFYYQGVGKIILHEKNLASDFFDLKSGLAGDILQKFSNYRVQLAIVGDFSKYQSKSLAQFIHESNNYGFVNFVGSNEEAKHCLLK